MKIGRLKPNTWTYLKKYWSCKKGDWKLTVSCPGCFKIMGINCTTIRFVKNGDKIKKEYIKHNPCGTILCLLR